uniref:SER_THR_PHOSPHATASE domain-containing protein n=1 Tax=Macrostomum lignano TaxID=282301 RepID=A0A1I8F9I2_9PLAT
MKAFYSYLPSGQIPGRDAEVLRLVLCCLASSSTTRSLIDLLRIACCEARTTGTRGCASLKASCEDLPAPAYVITDIHGQFSDLLNGCTGLAGRSTADTNLVCCARHGGQGAAAAGDGVPVPLLQAAAIPPACSSLRGNHEDFETARDLRGFYAEIEERFHECASTRATVRLAHGLWRMFIHVFDYLPVACVLEQRILLPARRPQPRPVRLPHLPAPMRALPPAGTVCQRHKAQLAPGALTSYLNWKRSLSLLNHSAYDFVLSDLLWSDPMHHGMPYMSPNDANWTSLRGWHFNSERQIAYTFGFDAIEKTMQQFNLACLIRGHETKPAAYEWHYLKRCVTVFSAPNYTGGNAATVALVTERCNGIRKRNLRIDLVMFPT